MKDILFILFMLTIIILFSMDYACERETEMNCSFGKSNPFSHELIALEESDV